MCYGGPTGNMPPCVDQNLIPFTLSKGLHKSTKTDYPLHYQSAYKSLQKSTTIYIVKGPTEVYQTRLPFTLSKSLQKSIKVYNHLHCRGTYKSLPKPMICIVKGPT